MTVLTETRERFLRTIAAHVPPERIAEIHFFQPIKQGGAESGVAVVAAWPESALAAEQEATVETPAEDAVVQPTATVQSTEAEAVVEVDDACDPIEVEASAEADGESDEAGADGDEASVEASSESSSGAVDESSADEPVEAPEIPPARVEPSNARHTIYTARYRLTLKGPDRGKWEANVVAEADAPLVTVDAVVRGVQRRSGDVDDATRLDGVEVRALLAPRQPIGTPPAQGAV